MAPAPQLPAPDAPASSPSDARHPLSAIEEASTPEAPVLDYDVALELQVLCATLVPRGHRVLEDQLQRASLSV